MLSRVSKGLARPGSRLLSGAAGSEKLAMVGSGNFGSALVRILGQNALRHDIFDNEAPDRAPRDAAAAPRRSLCAAAVAEASVRLSLRRRSSCTCTRR